MRGEEKKWLAYAKAVFDQQSAVMLSPDVVSRLGGSLDTGPRFAKRQLDRTTHPVSQLRKHAIKLAKADGLRPSGGASLKESYNSFLEAARCVQ